jgi:hypothetical protein
MPPIDRTGKIECEDEEILSQGIATSGWVTSQDVFVTSFSENGNLLSQWRAYSGASGGYSIGFRREHLREAGANFIDALPGRFYSNSDVLIRCRYCDAKEDACLKSDIEKIVTSYINEAVSAKKSPIPSRIEGFNTPGAIALKRFLPLGKRAAITKNSAFHEEAEWRFAFHLNRDEANSDLEFRAGRSMLTPYLKVPLKWEGQVMEVKEIVVGPCPHPNEAIESVKMLLRKMGIRGVEVVPCKIPYRSL